MVFKPSRPSVGSARKEEGQNPRAVNQIGTRPPGRWDNARRSTAPAPQSKPVTPASRLVAQVRAVGGIRARAENPGRRASSVCDSTPIAGVCNVITVACARETRSRSRCGTTLERDRGRPKLQRRRIQRNRRAELAGFYNSVLRTRGTRPGSWRSEACCARLSGSPRAPRR